MATGKIKITQVSGKKKEAIARAIVRQGNGCVRVNSMLLEKWEPSYARDKIRVPLVLAEGIMDLSGLNIDVSVSGGGQMGQADAIACAIARALIKHGENDELHSKYLKYDRTLIAGDHRQTEVHKPGQSSKGPRHKRQKSYR